MRRPSFRVLSGLLCFSLLGGASFFDSASANWLVSKNVPQTASVEAQTAVLNPVCYNGTTGSSYYDIKTAINNASSGQYVYMYVGAHVECSESFEIKNNVHLVLPFVGKHFDKSYSGANVSNSPLIKISSSDDYANYGNVLGDSNATNVAKYRSCSLKMVNGADITISSGGLHIGGAVSTKGNNGYYSELLLSRGCSLTFKNGTTLDCFGYIKENPDDFSNPANNGNDTKIVNELDEGRFVMMMSGSTLNSYLATYDAQTAGNLTNLISAKQCPFWEYDFPGIQTFLSVNSGANFDASVLMVGPNGLTIDKSMPVIRSSTEVESLFYLTRGVFNMEYVTSAPRFSSRNFDARHTNLVVDGDISVGYLYAKAGALSVTIELDTRDTFLPVNNRLSIFVRKDATLTSDKKVKFLAGSKLEIQEGGAFNINNKVIFHNKDTVVYDTTKSIYFRANGTNVDDAKLIVNGELSFNTDSKSNGAIGAYITHTSITGNGTIRTDRIASNSALSVESSEGAPATTIVVESSGPFENGDGKFAAGGSPYVSGFLSAEERFIWEGEQITSYKITVIIGTSSANNPSAQYSILSGTKSDGSDAAPTALVSKTTNDETEIIAGYYLTIELIRGVSAAIKKTATGETITSDYTDVVQVNEDITVEIVPAGTYNIVFKNELKSGAKSNGRGHVDYEVLECSTSNGQFETVYSTSDIDFSTTVTAGKYFKVRRTFDGMESLYNYFEDANTTITKDPNVGSKSNWNQYSTSLSPAYLADANYTFTSYWTYGTSSGGGCVLPDTMVTMADGSKRPIKDVAAGDMLLAFDHERGELVAAPVVFNEKDQATCQNVIYLEFDNGSKVGVISEHGFFDMKTLRYEYIDETNYGNFIGHRFYCEDGTTTTLEKAYVVCEYTECYELPTFYHLDFFTEGILSMPGGIQGLFNIYEYGEDLKYDEEAYARDVAEYGLFEYADLEPYGVTQEMFDAYGGKNLKVALGKGVLTEEYLACLIERYGKYTE